MQKKSIEEYELKSIEEYELNPDEARSEIFPAIYGQPEHPI